MVRVIRFCGRYRLAGTVYGAYRMHTTGEVRTHSELEVFAAISLTDALGLKLGQRSQRKVELKSFTISPRLQRYNASWKRERQPMSSSLRVHARSSL